MSNSNYFENLRQKAIGGVREAREALNLVQETRNKKDIKNLRDILIDKVEKPIAKIEKDFESQFNTLMSGMTQAYVNRNSSIRNIAAKSMFGGYRLNRSKTVRIRDMDSIIAKLKAAKINKNTNNATRKEEEARIAAEKKAQANRLAAEKKAADEKAKRNKNQKNMNAQIALVKARINKANQKLTNGNGSAPRPGLMANGRPAPKPLSANSLRVVKNKMD